MPHQLTYIINVHLVFIRILYSTDIFQGSFHSIDSYIPGYYILCILHTVLSIQACSCLSKSLAVCSIFMMQRNLLAFKGVTLPYLL